MFYDKYDMNIRLSDIFLFSSAISILDSFLLKVFAISISLIMYIERSSNGALFTSFAILFVFVFFVSFVLRNKLYTFQYVTVGDSR